MQQSSSSCGSDRLVRGIHILKAAKILRREFDLRRPRRIAAAEYQAVGTSCNSVPLYVINVEMTRLAIDAQQCHRASACEARRRDGDVRLKLLPGLQAKAGLGKGVDMIGDDRALPGELFEKVGIRRTQMRFGPMACRWA